MVWLEPEEYFQKTIFWAGAKRGCEQRLADSTKVISMSKLRNETGLTMDCAVSYNQLKHGGLQSPSRVTALTYFATLIALAQP